MITEEVSAWKVMFPTDWPRPASWIDVDDDMKMVRGLEHAMREYDSRFKIAARDAEFNRQTVIAVKRLAGMFRKIKES